VTVAARGPFFEDFEVGQRVVHAGRTITETDNIWFTLLTGNNNPIHLDAIYAAETEFGRPLVNSTLTLALTTGLSVSDLSRNGINLGWDSVRMPHPLFPGDTLRAESEILTCRPSRSRPTMGVIRVRTMGMNQEGTPVIEFERTILVYRRDDSVERL
jgi:itaconyl-CoA hydratase